VENFEKNTKSATKTAELAGRRRFAAEAWAPTERHLQFFNALARERLSK
jgi:hypothetical protein